MNKKYRQRALCVYCIFLLLFLAITVKILYLQIFKGDFFRRLAQNQHYRFLNLEGKRGTIFDRHHRDLATGMHCYSIFADPLVVEDPERLAKIMAESLDISEKTILDRLKRKKRFVWIKRKISWEEKEKIKSLKLSGIGFIREERRFYPQGSLSASVLGLVDIDNNGLEGIELFYNSYLSGKDGWARVLQDSASREVMISSQIVTPQQGADIILAIDAQLQYWAENYLDETIKEFKAKQGSVVVMDAETGEILVLANSPGFDAGDPKSLSPEAIRNRAITDMFEPGSVFKVVALLAALSENKFSEEDTVFCENGKWRIPGTTLHDWKPYGNLSFKQVFTKSSNIGVAKIVQVIGPEKYYQYMERLGFGRVCGVDLPGEVRGSLKPLARWSRTSPYIIPMGQEIGVNLLHLARVFAVVANGGFLVQPQIATSICARGFCKNLVAKREKVLSTPATMRAKSILIDVVSGGTGKRAAIKGRRIGGKTGTAQKYDPKIGRYSPSKYRATFVGFIDDLEPSLVIGVTIDEPKRSHFGGVVAAPLFRKIAEKAIKYLEQKEAVAKR